MAEGMRIVLIVGEMATIPLGICVPIATGQAIQGATFVVGPVILVVLHAMVMALNPALPAAPPVN